MTTRPITLHLRSHVPGGCTGGGAPRGCYFLLRRWTRVFFSSLRCFFFAMRLRRFLMTEPTKGPSFRRVSGRLPCAGGREHAPRYPPVTLPGRRRTADRGGTGTVDVPLPRHRAGGRGRSRMPSGGLDVGLVEVVVHGLLGHPEGPADPHGGQRARVDESVDGHLGHPHERGDLGDGEERDLRQRTFAGTLSSHDAPDLQHVTGRRLPLRQHTDVRALGPE